MNNPPTTPRGGRPTKRTLRRLLRLARSLRRGDPRSAACGAAGIGESTLRDWIAADASGRLANALDRWESRGEAVLVRIVRSAADTDPAQARWLLAVRRPAVYSQAGMTEAARRMPDPERSAPTFVVQLNGVGLSPDEERDLYDVREGRARVVPNGPASAA